MSGAGGLLSRISCWVRVPVLPCAGAVYAGLIFTNRMGNPGVGLVVGYLTNLGLLCAGTLVKALRTGLASAGETSLRRPAAGESGGLWDRWLDADAVVAAEPDITFVDDEPELEPEPVLVPRRASVRPRVIATESGDSMRLEDEVIAFARSGARGAIRIAGPFGSGKTTALAHLAASLPRELPVCVLDEPDPRLLAEVAARGVVVYAAARDTAHPRHLATFDLAPWGKDEWIEYLLATGRKQCASVMTRLEAAPDRDWLQGNPELWRIVLYRMACDPALASIHDALRQELADRLANGTVRRLAEEVCLAHLRNREEVQVQPDALEEELTSQCRDQALQRLILHRPIQLLIAARRIVTDLAESEQPCDYLGTRLPRDLVQEAGVLLREDSLGCRHLHFYLNSLRRDVHPMAASLLHAAGTGWRPAPESVCPPNLSGAYLDRVAWRGVDLRAVELKGADLSRAELQRAQFDAANLDRARLCQASLEGASMASAMARGADLNHADLVSLRAEAVDLYGANLEGANLTDAFLRNAQLLESNLKEARLSGADLTRANLCGAEIAGADFTGAILDAALLKGLTLFRSEFKQARFTAADLSGCDLEGMDLPRAAFRKARLQDALLTGSRMPDADFRDACLRSAGLAEVDWEGACLAGADLSLATFHLGSSRSGLVGSPIACEGSRTGFYTDDFDEQDFKPPESIRKANLCGADLRGAHLGDVDFYLVDLRGALFDSHQAEQFRRCGAILKHA